MRSLLAIGTTLALCVPALSHASPPAEVDMLYEVAVAPSPERIRSDIQTLVDFGTRHTLSETESDTRGIGAARRWISAEFEKISAECGGCLEVIYVSDTISGESRIPEPTEVVSVLAIQRGTTDPNRYVMMSGDIDSRVTDPLNGTSDSPGANDNASGMAGAIEAARVLSKHKFAGSIIYAGLSGEEQGLFGGKIVADYALAQGWEIKGVLNNDMISNISGIDGVTDNTTARVFSEGTRFVETAAEARSRRFTGGEVDSPSRNLARYVKAQADQYMTNLNVMMVYRLDRFGRGGHHRPFNQVGIPGVRIMETHEHYDRQHQDLRTEDGVIYGDTMDGVDAVYAAKLTALNAITLAGMAGAPPFPASVEIEGAVQPSAKMTWETPGNAGNLAGYRVHWRLTTEPEWTRSRFIGKVNEWSFDNLVIDNYFFGVSAVAKDGSETPVVFPGAAGRF
ncbi:peptidase M28 [Algimonas arctica]|uniref:Peptidase M28 n=1 Tax=Algimonas arctica TaxID=1479486 RepID=A0A8J3CKK3_9PROT|nr:M28 family metallopeptidase [Algimonas arctica]GHA82646.1 peptidase M28 [Algimonas arctica]